MLNLCLPPTFSACTNVGEVLAFSLCLDMILRTVSAVVSTSCPQEENNWVPGVIYVSMGFQEKMGMQEDTKFGMW